LAIDCAIPDASLEKNILGIPSFLLPWQPQVAHTSDGVDSLNPFLNPFKDLMLLAYQVYLWNSCFSKRLIKTL
jgi:hypothetical protein